CGYDAKQGRLAGTIRADQARDFALTDDFAGTDLSATGLACGYGLLAAVVVEAALRLAAEPTGLDVFHQQRAGPILGIGQTLVEHLHDGEAGVEADEVGEL